MRSGRSKSFLQTVLIGVYTFGFWSSAACQNIPPQTGDSSKPNERLGLLIEWSEYLHDLAEPSCQEVMMMTPEQVKIAEEFRRAIIKLSDTVMEPNESLEPAENRILDEHWQAIISTIESQKEVMNETLLPYQSVIHRQFRVAVALGLNTEFPTVQPINFTSLLGLNEQQQTALDKLARHLKDFGEIEKSELDAKIREIAIRSKEECLDVLTSDQMHAYDSLFGKPLDVNSSAK